MFECSLSQFSDPQPLALRSPQLVIARLTGVMEEGSVEGSKKETFISVLANNYPQTLGSFLMLRPPAFLLTVWKAVRMVMDPQTAKAYHFVRSQSQIDSTLDELFEPEVGDWIMMVQDAESENAGPCGPSISLSGTFTTILCHVFRTIQKREVSPHRPHVNLKSRP